MSKRRKYQDTSESNTNEDAAVESSSTQPASTGNKPKAAPSQMLLRPFRFLGSLHFGLAILCFLIVLFAWGTFIESEYGAAVSKFVLYGSRWFAGLLALLAVNLLCSMALRWPWRTHHLPFLLAHGGIVVLLFGCWMTWQYGLEARISLPEGTAGKMATQQARQHFTVRSIPHFGTDSSETQVIPFEPGPFNWEDYDPEKWNQQRDRRYRSTLGLAMKWGHRDLGILAAPSQDVQIKVLDYYAGSTVERVPPMELNVLWKKTMKTKNELGDVKETPRNWERVRLDIQPQDHFRGMEIRGTRGEMLGGERVTYCCALSMAEVEAFLNSRPDWSANFGDTGQAVLRYEEKNHFIDVDRLLRETGEGKRVTIPDTPFQIGNVRFRSQGLILSFSLYTTDGMENVMTLFADNPEMSVQCQEFGVFGTYWVSPEKLEKSQANAAGNAMLQRIVQKLSQPRLDILQGPDRKLYYRFWTGSGVASLGTVQEREHGKKSVFTIAAETPDEAEVVVEKFVPQDLPGLRIVARPVGKTRDTEQRARLEVTVDGKTDTFWLRALYQTVVPLPPERDQVRFVYGKGRTVKIQWDFDTIDLGFGVFLKTFEMRNEPGTRMSSHYSSLVDFVDMDNVTDVGYSRSPNEFRPYENGRDVLISMNQPAVFRGTGRKYRVYQSSFAGPWHPGDFRFHELYDGKIFPWETRPRETIYVSTLSVNDDPGRGMKYLGCFLLVFGTALFVYRKKTN